MLRGKDSQGRDLIIARDYISHGMRERVAELVDLDLGPRSDRTIESQLRAEVEQERLTSIDRTLAREQDADGLVAPSGGNAFEQAVRVGRLRKLERLGLAHPARGGRWKLVPGFSEALRRMGERGDIIRTMQRALNQCGRQVAASDLAIYDPVAQAARPIVGRLLERGLSDELNDRHYLIIEGIDGRTHHVDVGIAPLKHARPGSIVRIDAVAVQIREADRTIAAIAAANHGRYDVEAHLRHDPAASEAFAQAHVRRLEAMRRATGAVTREPDGTWIIQPDHLDHALAYEFVRLRDRPVAVELLSNAPLEQLIEADAATWLDTELMSAEPLPLRETGFGEVVRLAQLRRQQWLLSQGLLEERDGLIHYRPDLIDVLRRRELLRIADRLSHELGLEFTEIVSGERIHGLLRRPVESLNGRYALIERSRDFTLVPWRPVLEPHIGRVVSGLMRRQGVSWTIGRERSGPNI
jgi:hypothetical protein